MLIINDVVSKYINFMNMDEDMSNHFINFFYNMDYKTQEEIEKILIKRMKQYNQN